MIVPDASVILELLLGTGAAERVGQRLLDGGEGLHAPHLLDLEVAQVLRRYAARGELPADRAREALSLLARFPMIRYPHEPLLPRIWELRHNLTAYDAAYVSLAEALPAVFITRDEKLASVLPRTVTAEIL